MVNTYTQIYIHIVFAVESRQNLIQPEHNDELQKYITGIVSGQKQKLIAINNMPDHLHMLVGLKPELSLSELVRDVKANSSRFIKEKKWVLGRFSWQEGFGAFSHSRSQLDTVIRYIQNQQKHHVRKPFRDEYIELLEKFGVSYDQRYIFKTGDECLSAKNMPPRWGLRFFGLGSTKISLLTGLGQRTAGGRTLTLPPRLHVGNTANKRTKMALTREYKKTVIARIKRDRKFARLIYAGAIDMLLEGETAEALSRLRDLVHAGITFKELAHETGLGEKPCTGC